LQCEATDTIGRAPCVLRRKDPDMPHTTIEAMRRCIDECHSCQEICLESVGYGLELGGQHASAAHIRALLDCSEACQLAADFMVRGSERHVTACELCAEACLACAEECDRLNDDDLMRRCAEACRRCAETCSEMARAAVSRVLVGRESIPAPRASAGASP
jgi:hypothetical protein